MDNKGFLFPKSQKTYSNWMSDARKGIDCKQKLVCHSLRHGFIQTLIEDGFNNSLVSKAVGHKSTKSTDHYIHHSDVVKKSLKRRNPVTIMYEKVKKHKGNDYFKYECPVQGCIFVKGKLKGI